MLILEQIHADNILGNSYRDRGSLFQNLKLFFIEKEFQ